MKCKKIFALLLSLCMVLSTFVAVSAQEQVYVEENVRTLVDINKDFASVDSDVLYGDGITGGSWKESYEGETGVVGGTVSTTSTGYIGFELPVLALYKGDVVTISLKVYMTADWTSTNTTTGVLVRSGNSWAPTAAYQNVLQKDKNVSKNAWTTLTNTFTLNADVANGQKVYLQVRPDTEMDFYIDEISIKIEGARETVAYVNATMDDAATGILSSSSTVNYSEGKATVTMSGAGNNDMVGVKLVDKNGTPVTSLKTGDVVNWSVKINPSSSFTPGGFGNGTKGILLRVGDTRYPPTTSGYKQLAASVEVPANTETVWKGSAVLTSDYRGNGIYMNIRPEFIGTMILDDFVVEIIRGAEKQESGWADVDYTKSITVAKAHTADVFTVSEDAFTIDVAKVKEKITSSNVNSTTCWLRITPAEPLKLSDDWTISFDITASGITDKDGQTGANLRLFDNTTGTTMANTLGWINSTVKTADGTVSVQYNSKSYAAAGSGSGDVASLCVCYNLEDGAYEAGTGTVTFSNFKLVENGTKVALSAAKTSDGVELTLSNANDEAYKVLGRLLIAEYASVGGTAKLVQFAETAIENVVNANGTATVTASFKNDITGGNTVSVFVWEPGSLTPITALPQL